MLKQSITPLLLVGLLVTLGACQKSPEEARHELEQMGIKYSPTAFVTAARNSDLLAVEFFLLAGMNPDAQDEAGITALLVAAGQGHTASVEVLLAAGAQPDVQPTAGMTALLFAAVKGHTASVEALLAAGAQPDSRRERSRTCRRQPA